MRISSYELKSTARTLRKNAGFTTVAILSLALGIGINTTMYSTLDAMFNPRVDMPNPQNLASIFFFGDRRHRVDMRTRNSMLASSTDVFESLTTTSVRDYESLIESDVAHRTGVVLAVRSNYFSVLGVHAKAGRLLSDTDVGAPTPSVVLSERTVRDLFPGARDPIGQRIELQGEAYIVIGVLGRESNFAGNRTAAWTLPESSIDVATLPLNMGRLRPGVTAATAEAKLKVVTDRIAAAAGEPPRENAIRVFAGGGGSSPFRLGGFQKAIALAVIAVLLVACANIANLQLARAISRSRELATRAALGASRRDLIMHLLLESAILAAAGLVLGLMLTFWGMHVIRASIPVSIGEYMVEPQTSWRLFAFAAGAAGVCVLLIGLLPAIRVSRVDLSELIKRGAGTGSTRSARRQYGYLISAEIGFALVVLCAAALLVRTAYRLDTAAHAWDQSKLTSASAQVALAPRERRMIGDVSAELVTRLRSVTDVADVATTTSRRDDDKVVTATDPGGKLHVVPANVWSYQIVSSSFLRTMGFEIAHGRDFIEGERGPVAIVDPRTARRLWPSTEAIGHMIKFGAPNTPGRWYTVIGVRKPVGIESTESSSDALGAVFVLATDEDKLTGAAVASKNPGLDVLVRASRNAYRMPNVLRRVLAGDSHFTISHAGTLDEKSMMTSTLANQRFVARLFSVFSILSLGLAALGIYGVVAHSVAERRREIGVRIALGSSASRILHLVLREGNVFALAGVAIGLFLILRGAPLLANFLPFPEIDMYSVELYLPAAVFFFAVATLAAFIPAFRATKLDPVEALRCE